MLVFAISITGNFIVGTIGLLGLNMSAGNCWELLTDKCNILDKCRHKRPVL